MRRTMRGTDQYSGLRGGDDDESGHAAGAFAIDPVRLEDGRVRHGAEPADKDVIAPQSPRLAS